MQGELRRFLSHTHNHDDSASSCVATDAALLNQI